MCTQIKKIAICFLFLFSLVACKKYLDVKSAKNLVVPTTLADLQALLDNNNVVNNNSPALLELVADNYYLPSVYLPNVGPEEASNYIWDKNALSPELSWKLPYQYPIFYSNIVLDHLPVINVGPNETDKFNSVKGSALFYRAFAFYELAQLYCRPYSSTANTEPGIVLRLSSNINEKSVRATVQQTYDQIIGDLKEAVDLLPQTTIYPTRPCKAAAYGALARTYLSMRDYSNAKVYADLCLQERNGLLDYNTLVPVGRIPVPRFNIEVIFHNSTQYSQTLANYMAQIDSMLYNSYDPNDLRKTVFFKASAGGHAFQGTYGPQGRSGSDFVFDGITTAEMFLIRAECNARAGNKDAALDDLNTLMAKRWNNTVTYQNITATDAVDALQKVLVERRKELVYRGLRWTDLRRLNLEGSNITLTRKVDANSYTLPPNDNRWVILIPDIVISRAGIQQNPR